MKAPLFEYPTYQYQRLGVQEERILKGLRRRSDK